MFTDWVVIACPDNLVFFSFLNWDVCVCVCGGGGCTVDRKALGSR